MADTTKRCSSSVFMVFIAAFVPCLSNAYQFNVGGIAGWVVNPPENYNHWAGRMRFQVNDTLFFKYNKGSNSVLEVNRDDYGQCNVSNPILRLDDGNSIFKFDRSGPFYFISGNRTFCDQGQKLIVVVLAIRHRHPPQTPAPPGQPPALAPASGPASGAVPTPAPATGAVPTPAPASGAVPTPAPALAPATTPVPATAPGLAPATTPVPATAPLGPSMSPISPSPVATTPSNAPTPSMSPISPSPVATTPSNAPTPSMSPISPSPVATTPSNAPTPGVSPVSSPPAPSGEASPPPPSSGSQQLTPPGSPPPPANSTSPSNTATRPAFTPSIAFMSAVSIVFSVTFGAPIFL